MKILVICQYYKPEPFRVSEICEALVQRGHDVTVVAGIPNYPMGEVYSEYRHGRRRDEVINGVKIHRCFTFGRKHGFLHRFLNYYSFVLSSTGYVRKTNEEFDVVFVNQLSPVMMANAGIKYSKKHGVPLVLYCLDLWPESLVAGGIKKGGVIYRCFHKISKAIYSKTDKLLITSQLFAEYFSKEFDITDTEYLPQFAETIFTSEMCRKDPDENFDLMFAGNIGSAQSLETIVKAAVLTADIPGIRWHIVGEGSDYERIKTMAKDIENIFFYGRKSIEEMPKYYAMADAMIVTLQKNSMLSMTMPGKVQTYMAAGKPIVGAIDGETAYVIADADCGICTEAENAEALADSVRKMVCMDIGLMGNNARKYYESHFEKTSFLDKLEMALASNS